MANVCKFVFNEGINKKSIEEKLALSIITAECTFGKEKVRLNAAYMSSENKVVIDVSNKIGEYIAQVFTGLATRQFGEDNFTVDRIKGKVHE